ncbi:MAG: CCA tRNA nucleotidyltransferase [Eubacterium sp.]|nr:CCA tRNA nucleotidyltransferase [Eubacterium sp.]
MFLPKNAEKIINMLAENGYKAYAVGGCVRDFLLEKACDDVDIATSALPDEVERILNEKNIKVFETGLKHGTVTAVMDSENYEITTFRRDGDYKDSRRPETVDFVTDIADDLSRRDFTVNAMAYNHSEGVVDLFGGSDDLKNKIIRAVGDPDKRFNEDALRIMRALRFSSVLGFAIEENTKRAIFDNMYLLNNISAERIFSELTKLLLGDNAVSVLDEYRDVVGVIIPELKPCFDCVQNNPWHIYNVYGHIIHTVGAAPKDKIIRLAMLLHDIGKPQVKTTDEKGIDHFKTHAVAGAEIAKTVLKRFKVSNEIYDKVTALIYHHQSVENVDEIRIKRWLSRIGEDYTRSLLQVRIADLLGHNPEKIDYELEKIKALQRELEEAVSAGAAFKISDLKINGNDLKSLGYEGKKIGDKLNELLALVVDDKLENDKTALISYLKSDK